MKEKAEKLKRHLEENRIGKEQDKKRHEFFNQRKNEIDEADNIKQNEFWCRICKKDFSAPGYKYERRSWGNSPGYPIAWYVGECPAGHEARRYITDKHLDPYYEESENVRWARVEFEKDLIQPNDPRFKKLYGDPFKQRAESDRN